jgi:hypothetical protein
MKYALYNTEGREIIEGGLRLVLEIAALFTICGFQTQFKTIANKD